MDIKECQYIRYKEEGFFNEVSKRLMAQRGGRWSIPVNIQGLDGLGSEQPDLDVPAH